MSPHEIELRLLRDRLARVEPKLRRRVNRSSQSPVITVRVIDNGNLPTEPNRVHICEVITRRFKERDGSSLAVDVAEGTRIPVGVLGPAQAVGTQMVAHSVGDRWVARPKKGQPCDPYCLTVAVSNTDAQPIEGATVELLDGETVVASCQTNSVGECQMCDLTIVGSRTLRVSKTDYKTHERTLALACEPRSENVALRRPLECICIKDFGVPESLQVTLGNCPQDYNDADQSYIVPLDEIVELPFESHAVYRLILAGSDGGPNCQGGVVTYREIFVSIVCGAGQDHYRIAYGRRRYNAADAACPGSGGDLFNLPCDEPIDYQIRGELSAIDGNCVQGGAEDIFIASIIENAP